MSTKQTENEHNIGDHVLLPVKLRNKKQLGLVVDKTPDSRKLTVLVNKSDMSRLHCFHERIEVKSAIQFTADDDVCSMETGQDNASDIQLSGWFHWRDRTSMDHDRDEFFENLSVLYQPTRMDVLRSCTSNYFRHEQDFAINSRTDELDDVDEDVVHRMDADESTGKTDKRDRHSASNCLGDRSVLRDMLGKIENDDITVSTTIATMLSRALNGTLINDSDAAEIEEFTSDSIHFLQTHYCSSIQLEPCVYLSLCLLKMIKALLLDEASTSVLIERLLRSFREHDFFTVANSMIQCTRNLSDTMRVELLDNVTSILYHSCTLYRDMSTMLLHMNYGTTFWNTVLSYSSLLEQITDPVSDAHLSYSLITLTRLLSHIFDRYSTDIKDDMSSCFYTPKRRLSLVQSITELIQDMIPSPKKVPADSGNDNALLYNQKKEAMLQLPEILRHAVVKCESHKVIRLVRRVYLIASSFMNFTDTMIEMVVQVGNRNPKYAETVLYTLNSLSSSDGDIIGLAIRHFIVRSLKRLVETSLMDNRIQDFKSLVTLILQLAHVHGGFKRRVFEEMRDTLYIRPDYDITHMLANHKLMNEYLERISSHAMILSPPTPKTDDTNTQTYTFGTDEMEGEIPVELLFHKKKSNNTKQNNFTRGMTILSYLIDSLLSLTKSFIQSFISLVFLLAALSIIGLFAILLFLLIRHGEPTVIKSYRDGGSSSHSSTTNDSPDAGNRRRHLQKFVTKNNNKTSEQNGRNQQNATSTVLKEQGECQWLNFILKRVMVHFIYKHTSIIKKQLLSQLNRELKLPDIVGEIDIIDLNLGRNTPSFYSIQAFDYVQQQQQAPQSQSQDDKNTKNSNSGGGGGVSGMAIDIDMEIEDPEMKVQLGTNIYLNFPVKRFASLPVQFSLQDIYFHAKVRIFISDDFSQMNVCLREEPEFDMVFSNEIGARQKIRNLPWITDLINRGIYQFVTKFFLAPKVLSFHLPPIVLFQSDEAEESAIATGAAASAAAAVSASSGSTPVIIPATIGKRRVGTPADSLNNIVDEHGVDGDDEDDDVESVSSQGSGGIHEGVTAAVGAGGDMMFDASSGGAAGGMNEAIGMMDDTSRNSMIGHDDDDDVDDDDEEQDEHVHGHLGSDEEQIQRLARQLRQRKLMAAAKKRAAAAAAVVADHLDEEFLDFLQSKEASDFQAKRLLKKQK